jgi:hypothetical protein
MTELPRLTADRCGDLCRDDGVPVFFACGIGMALGAEVAARCNDYPRLQAFAADLAAACRSGVTADILAAAERARVLVPLREGPGLTDDDDWRLDEALNGRR